MANDLISDITKGCPFGVVEYPSGYLYASKTKTDLDIVIAKTGETTGLFLMRGSKEYRNVKSNYTRYGYQYLVAEKFGIRLARWMKRTGKRVFAHKFVSPKYRWTALDMHQCEKKVRDEFSNGFFTEGEKLGITRPEDGWLYPGPLRMHIDKNGVLIALDPEKMIPYQVMHTFVDSMRLERLP